MGAPAQTGVDVGELRAVRGGPMRIIANIEGFCTPAPACS